MLSHSNNSGRFKATWHKTEAWISRQRKGENMGERGEFFFWEARLYKIRVGSTNFRVWMVVTKISGTETGKAAGDTNWEFTAGARGPGIDILFLESIKKKRKWKNVDVLGGVLGKCEGLKGGRGKRLRLKWYPLHGKSISTLLLELISK